jgi:hypothetical protein
LLRIANPTPPATSWRITPGSGVGVGVAIGVVVGASVGVGVAAVGVGVIAVGVGVTAVGVGVGGVAHVCTPGPTKGSESRSPHVAFYHF